MSGELKPEPSLRNLTHILTGINRYSVDTGKHQSRINPMVFIIFLYERKKN